MSHKKKVSIDKTGWVFQEDSLDLIMQDMELEKDTLLRHIYSTMWDRKKDAEDSKNWLTMDADQPREPMKTKKIRVKVDVTIEQL